MHEIFISGIAAHITYSSGNFGISMDIRVII